ncbi:MAG TPA: hypothetical protein VJ692_16935, partial [Nitrospiraceae bacterium]|nr:hypothetical protein [Nitrospiraceae bacterium]
LVDPDFGWHLRTGLDLIATGRLPKTDPYSHTMPDWPWVEHAWLMDGIIGLIYSGLGGVGVIVLFAAVIASALIMGAASARASRTIRFISVAAVAWIALPFLGARMQMVTLLGVAIVLWLWRTYRDERLTHLWAMPMLFLLWANVHGGFTAGLFTVGVILMASGIARLTIMQWPSLSRRIAEPILSWPQIRHLALVFVISILITLINPYGWRLHGEIYASLTDRFMLDTLREWQSVSLYTRAGAIYVIYVVTLAGALVAWYRRVEPVRWAVFAVFLLLSLRHSRNVPFFLLVSLPVWAEMLSASATRMSAWVPAEWIARGRAAFAGSLLMAITLVLLGSGHLERVARCGLATDDFFRDTEYPIEAVHWVQAHRGQLGSNLYNDYGLGGFLLWWLPGEKIFIDGRMPAWRVGDRWILYDYLVLANRDPPEFGVLNKYLVDWAIVGRETTLERAMASQPEWRKVYEDLKVRIYVKA